MPRPEFINRIKAKIDNGDFKKEADLVNPFEFAKADEEERRILTEYLYSKYPKATGAGPAFKGPFTAGDIQGDVLGSAPFANQALSLIHISEPTRH